MIIDTTNLFRGPREIQQISIDNASDVLKAGLGYYCGEGFKWLPAYDKIAEWMKDNGHKGLLLTGGNGTGKTTMAKILFFTFEEFKHDSVSFDSAYMIQRAWEQYSSVQIIDDIGVEGMSTQYGEIHDYFSQIVDKAERTGQLLICTTNLNSGELRQKYGDRTFDRMSSIFKVIAFEGKSFRGV